MDSQWIVVTSYSDIDRDYVDHLLSIASDGPLHAQSS